VGWLASIDHAKDAREHATSVRRVLQPNSMGRTPPCGVWVPRFSVLARPHGRAHPGDHRFSDAGYDVSILARPRGRAHLFRANYVNPMKVRASLREPFAAVTKKS
jgi:hypothetical protein